MLAVAKTPHINVEFRGIGTDIVINALRSYVPNIRIDENEDENELVESEDCEWFKEIERSWHSGKTLRVRRINRNYTQKKLSELTGISVRNISKMENGKVAINKDFAELFAIALDCHASDFME